MDHLSEIKRIVPLNRVRNIGIIAHVDAGKTTLSERILFYTGTTWRLGEVHEGTATMDYMLQEQERGITITSAATTCFWNDHRINLIDMPGHIDFVAEVERSLRVVDGVVAVFCAVEGVQAQTEVVWRQADKHRVPIIAFVNKMDREGADFHAVVLEIQHRFDKIPVPLYIPLQDQKNGQRRLLDVIRQHVNYYPEKGYGREFICEEIPADELEYAQRARQHVIECLAGLDETIMELYIEDREVSDDLLMAVLRKLTLSREIVPVTCGSAFQNWGIQPILDMLNDFLPSPLDREDEKGIDPESEQICCRKAGDDQDFSALIFKIIRDPRYGSLAFFRVFSGVAVPGNMVMHIGEGVKKEFYLGKVLQIHANYYEQRNGIFSGDIGAIQWNSELRTGDTLCDADHLIRLESSRFPEPVVAVAVEPKSGNDYEQLLQSLNELVVQDPTLRLKYNDKTGQIVLSGMGELHLDIILERIRREYHTFVNVGAPQVTCYATFDKTVVGQAEIDKDFGALHMFGKVNLELNPLQRGEGVEIDLKKVESALSQEFLDAIRQGINSAVEHGVGTCPPLTDVRISVTECLCDFAMESAKVLIEKLVVEALENTAKQTEPILLIPWMKVIVDCPQDYVGNVLAEFRSRSGRIQEVETQSRTTRVIGLVPLTKLFGYATALRSLTSGRAVFVSELACFAEATD